MAIGKLDNTDRDISNPNFTIYGDSITTFGLENRGAVNGLGLVTRGLVWQIFSIWTDRDKLDSLTTSWSNSVAAITTTWTLCQFGLYGDSPEL